jgi:polyphosphate kinase
LQQKTKTAAARRPFHPSHFLNRELSWLEFNQRVLDEARDSKNPLLERLKFFCIVSSNLDEFFEIRLTASEAFRAVTRRIRQMVDDQYACWNRDIMPSLARHGIRLLGMEQVSGNVRTTKSDRY